MNFHRYFLFTLVAFMICMQPILGHEERQHVLLQRKSAPIELVSGQGSSFAQPIYSEWIFAYGLVQPGVKFTYLPSDSSLGIASQINQTSDFGGTDIAPDADQYAEAISAGRLLTLFPTVAGAVVPVVNLNTGPQAKLIFDRPTLGRIYSGAITRWNDPQIAALNPTVALPDQPILVVVRSDSSGTTTLWTKAMQSFLGPVEWPYGAGPVFNQSLLEALSGRLIQTRGSYGVLSHALTTPYTIGYLNYAFTLDAGLAYAGIVNRLGQNATAQAGVSTALAAISLQPDHTGDLIDVEAADAWPISGLTYLLLDLNTSHVPAQRCEVLSQIVRWIQWSLLETAPIERAQSSGYTNLPLSMATAVVHNLTALTCNGAPLLQYDFVDQRTSGVWIAMLTIACVCALIPVILFLAFVSKPERRALSNIGLWYTLLTLTGSLLLTTAVVLFYLVPTNDAICGLQPWFVGLGFVFLLTPMLSKVCFLLLVAKDSNIYSFVRPTLIVTQLIILVIWTSVDLYSSTVIVLDPYTLQAEYQCRSDDIWVWMGLEIGFYGLILLLGLALTLLSTRATSTESQCEEIRWIGFAIYNLAIFAAILIPILAALDVTQEIRYFLICLGLIVPAIFIDLALYGQFLLEFVNYQTVGELDRSTTISSRDVL